VPHVAGRLALTHLRDALRGTPDSPGFEVSLGKGQLDLPAFLEMLAQTGPPRPMMLARSGGENPVDDLRAARKLIADLQRTTHRA
jgi:sugar phosphate isomerase/epimerase